MLNDDVLNDIMVAKMIKKNNCSQFGYSVIVAANDAYLVGLLPYQL